MQRRSQRVWLVGALGIALTLVSGCSKQIDTKSGSAELEGGMAKQRESTPQITQSEVKQSAVTQPEVAQPEVQQPEVVQPDETPPLSQAPLSEPVEKEDGLKGFEPAPLGSVSSEERVSEGLVVAKAESSEVAGRQAEDMRKEQAATALAGLKDVFFPFDSWKITEEGRQALSFDAQWLKNNPGTQITVEGHCDERGTQAYNLVLAEKRAKAVRTYLAELGVDVNRLSVASLGKERPFCREHGETCYQQNRRVHVVPRGQ